MPGYPPGQNLEGVGLWDTTSSTFLLKPQKKIHIKIRGWGYLYIQKCMGGTYRNTKIQQKIEISK